MWYSWYEIRTRRRGWTGLKLHGLGSAALSLHGELELITARVVRRGADAVVHHVRHIDARGGGVEVDNQVGQQALLRQEEAQRLEREPRPHGLVRGQHAAAE